MNEEQNNKVKEAKSKIQELDHEQAQIYSALCKELELNKPKENWFFDFIYNSTGKETFDEYLARHGRADLA